MMKGAITFWECVIVALEFPGFVKEFDRLFECSLSKVGRGAPINQMVDEATGFYIPQMALFVAFIYETTWTRLAPEMLNLATDPGPEIAIPMIEFAATHP